MAFAVAMATIVAGCTAYYRGKRAYSREDYATAFKDFGKAFPDDCDSKWREAQMYEKGQGTTQDYEKALEWYRKAADCNTRWSKRWVTDSDRVRYLAAAKQASDDADRVERILNGHRGAPPAVAQGVPPSDEAVVSFPAEAPTGLYDPRAAGDFDSLDGVTVDPQHGSIILFGHASTAGSLRRVPYLDYLAATLQSSNPTFSLEWTAESRRSLDAAFHMPDDELTNQLAKVVVDGRVTKRGAWWFRMVGVDAYEGMGQRDLWKAVFPIAGYPHVVPIVDVTEEITRAVAAGDLNAKHMDPDGHPRSAAEHLINVTTPLVFDKWDQGHLDIYGAALNGDRAAIDTVLSWVLVGMARAYKFDDHRYLDRYNQRRGAGDSYDVALTEAVRLADSDDILLQTNAFHALFANVRTIDLPPEMMNDVFGIAPVVAPAFNGLPATSLLAKTAFEADVFGKNLMDLPAAKAAVPSYRTYFEWRQTVSRAPADEGHTWFAPDGFELIESADGRTVRFGKTSVRIHMERYQSGSSGRASVEDPLLKQYADELTGLYDPLGARYPVLLDLRESMKVMAIADWMKRKGIKLSLPAQGRGSWTPPATYPGVIRMQMATQPQAQVSEVISASGGVDFRIDGDWRLIKQAIEDQPGPPPAHGVVICYLASGEVTSAQPIEAGVPACAPITAGSSGTDLAAARTADSGTQASGAGTAGPGVAAVVAGSPGIAAPGHRVVDCQGEQLRARISRLRSGLPVMQDAIDRTRRELLQSTVDGREANEEALRAMRNAAFTEIEEEAKEFFSLEKTVRARLKGLPSGDAKLVQALARQLDETESRFGDLLKLEGGLKQTGALDDPGALFAASKGVSDDLLRLYDLSRDSGLMEAAGEHLAESFGPVSEMAFRIASASIDITESLGKGILADADRARAKENLARMEDAARRVRSEIDDLEEEASAGNCP